MISRLSWSTASFGIGQAIRLLINIILATLLTPQIFGVMLLVNSIRTGIELTSDVGISQNIVSNPRGSEPDFCDTAWTIQVLRGLLLGTVVILLAHPLARYFERPELTVILPVASLFFIFPGFDSLARPLLQKSMELRRLAIFQITIAFISLIAHVGVALVTQTIWALVVGGILSAAAAMVGSYLVIPGLRHRMLIKTREAHQQLRFGGWIFLSTVIYFLAMNFDRLYFAKQISFAQLGIYGIARALADVFGQLIGHVASYVLYPMVAAAGIAGSELRQKLLKGRRFLLLVIAVALGLFLALSDQLIKGLYDARYAEGALILPILLVGTWFTVLTATTDAILMGLSRPAYAAAANGLKLASYVIGIPLAFHSQGFFAAIVVISAGELVKYLSLSFVSRKENVRFWLDDFILTLVFLGSAILFRELLHVAGLTGDWRVLFAGLANSIA